MTITGSLISHFRCPRAREATGINPLHRRRHPATVGRPASGRPGSRPYRRRSRTTTFGQKLVTFASRATASSRRRCPRGLEARRAGGAPSQALRGGGTGLGLVMGYANTRGTPLRRSSAAWRLPVSGRTVHGSQLAVRGRFWAVGAQFLPGAPEAAASLSVPHEGSPALQPVQGPPGKGRYVMCAHCF